MIKNILIECSNIDFQVIMTGDISVNEVVTANEDNSFTVFVNDRLMPNEKRKAILHALEHIRNNDFHSNNTADEIEAKRHI